VHKRRGKRGTRETRNSRGRRKGGHVLARKMATERDRQMALDECGLAHTAISDEQELELGNLSL